MMLDLEQSLRRERNIKSVNSEVEALKGRTFIRN